MARIDSCTEELLTWKINKAAMSCQALDLEIWLHCLSEIRLFDYDPLAHWKLKVFQLRVMLSIRDLTLFGNLQSHSLDSCMGSLYLLFQDHVTTVLSVRSLRAHFDCFACMSTTLAVHNHRSNLFQRLSKSRVSHVQFSRSPPTSDSK